MQVLQTVFDWILSLGAAVFVPVIMLVAGLVVRMKWKDAVSSAITLGVAFTGMSMLIGFMTGAIEPAATAMMERTGIELSIIDGGWTSMASISWTWPFAFAVFPLQIVVNIIMLAIKKTDTFNADLWNVWGKIFTAFIIEAVAAPFVGKVFAVVLAFAVAAFQIIMELKTADVHQHRIEKLSGIPGVTCTHKMNFFAAVMYPIDLLLRKIPALDKPVDAAKMREKLGIFSENHIIGFILGILFGIVAGFSVADTLGLAIKAATALMLFPIITKLFMQALSPISEAISDYMNKRFAGRKLFVGIDWPFLGGANEIWLVIIIAIPFTLLWAAILPGNNILPFAGIINISLVVPLYLLTKGNTPRMLILSILGIPAFLWVGTAFAPMITDLGRLTGALDIPAGSMISNSSIDGPVFTYAFSHIFKFFEGNFIPLIIAAAWCVSFFFYSRELRKEQKADLAAEAAAE